MITRKIELNEVELQMIEQWVSLAESLGVARSYGQIYGFCFIKKDPVSAQDCVDALRISRSSAGQGLRMLREIGAIRPHFELGSRVELYTIEPDLGVLVKSIAQGKLLPAFDGFFDGMEVLQSEVGAEDVKRMGYLMGRFEKLARWRTKLREVSQWLVR